MTAIYTGAGFEVSGTWVVARGPMETRSAKEGDTIQIGEWGWVSEDSLTTWSEWAFVDAGVSPPVRVMVSHGAVLELQEAIAIVVPLDGGYKNRNTVPAGRYTLEIGGESQFGERRLTERFLVPLHSDADSRFQLGLMQPHSRAIRVVSIPEGEALRTA